MLLAIFCKRMVLPVRAGAAIRPRCPLPIGVTRSMTRISTSSGPVSSVSRRHGCNGTWSWNWTLAQGNALALGAHEGTVLLVMERTPCEKKETERLLRLKKDEVEKRDS